MLKSFIISLSVLLPEAYPTLPTLAGVAWHPVGTDRTLRKQASVAGGRTVRIDHPTAVGGAKVAVLGAQVETEIWRRDCHVRSTYQSQDLEPGLREEPCAGRQR